MNKTDPEKVVLAGSPLIGEGNVVDARAMISGQQMLLVYPSEQLRHLLLLTQENVFPNVVWLPPRGQHEVINLSWAMKKGFSGTVCIHSEYQWYLRGKLIDLGVGSSVPEFVPPERLSAEHFKPSPIWQYESGAVPFEHVVRKFSISI